MSEDSQGFRLQSKDRSALRVELTGDWTAAAETRDFSRLAQELAAAAPASVLIDGAGLGAWDSLLPATLLSCHDYCLKNGIDFSTANLPAPAQRLLAVATTVPPHAPPAEPAVRWWSRVDLVGNLRHVLGELRGSLAFLGEVAVAIGRLVTGRANTRFTDFRSFCYQAGPDALGIISLTSVLVGMILGYLGAVQLQQFGAGIYVADLVVIGMLREMGPLMAAIVMAGRTGAAYAAQLGTMQTNEEIDAITTMGVSPIEFLVVPRMLALVAVMPLLTLYADFLGIAGGGIVASGLGITPLQYVVEGLTVLDISHLAVGLGKSVVFGALIAVAGCRSGINSGRSSAAVGQAATEAVVTALIYLIVADAAINIICQELSI
jgi:phospholipid/cholesterol/gamma-HCH transport system permease protein